MIPLRRGFGESLLANGCLFMTLARVIAALLLIGGCAHAQPDCPVAVNFQARYG
jgi:hypothetical protein